MPTTVEAVLPESTLWERIHEALQTSPYFDEQQVQFAARRGKVTLRGNVDSFYKKQMAQEVILRLDGVERVDNLLEVRWHTNGRPQTAHERQAQFC
jgi:osmotically-inducible protein OsmY